MTPKKVILNLRHRVRVLKENTTNADYREHERRHQHRKTLPTITKLELTGILLL
jgi:hypothetical protein